MTNSPLMPRATASDKKMRKTTDDMVTWASRVLVPVRYAAWLAGELGQSLHKSLEAQIKESKWEATVTRLPRGFLVESHNGSHGRLVDLCIQWVTAMENEVRERYPVFHSEMGPIWTGTVQCIVSRGEVA